MDSHVAKHLYEQVIGPDGLLSTKARLLCTNNITFVGETDEILMLRAGSVVERAHPRGGMLPETQISKLLHEFGRSTPRPGSPVSDPDSEDTAVMVEGTEKIVRSRRGSMFTRRASMLSPGEQRKALREASKNSHRPKEFRATGSVEGKVYKDYIKANGTVSVCLYLVTLGLVQALSISTNIWLKNWSQVSLAQKRGDQLAH